MIQAPGHECLSVSNEIAYLLYGIINYANSATRKLNKILPNFSKKLPKYAKNCQKCQKCQDMPKYAKKCQKMPKNAKNVKNAKICQNMPKHAEISTSKLNLKAQKHLHLTTFETLKHLQKTSVETGIDWLGENWPSKK
jgi:hypothetical protein